MLTQANTHPTTQNYAELQRAYDHFNLVLFEGKLPACLITLQREKRTCGYFSHQRFADLDGHTTDEIAFAYFSDRGRLIQADRGRRIGVAVAALGKRAGTGVTVS